MVQESEFFDAKPNKVKIWEMCQVADGIVYLARNEGKSVGFIAAVKQRYFFSDRERVTDMGFYVLPEYRGTSAAIRLIRALEDWTKENNITDLYLGQTTSVDIEKTSKFFNHLGYKTVGFNTVKHLH